MANAEFIKEWRKTLIAHDPDHDAQQSLPSMVSKTNAATTLRPRSINKTTRRRESYQQDRDRKTNPTTIQREMNGLKCCAHQCVRVFLNLGLILSLRAQYVPLSYDGRWSWLDKNLIVHTPQQQTTTSSKR